MTILALETSCDESAAAILQGDTHPPALLASLISSQIDLHRAYGGVVPELASRNHALRLHPLVAQTLDAAGLSIHDIDAFAATRGPGLASSLLVGHSMAKALALASGKPFLSVNHMEGHLLAPMLEDEAPAFDGDTDDVVPASNKKRKHDAAPEFKGIGAIDAAYKDRKLVDGRGPSAPSSRTMPCGARKACLCCHAGLSREQVEQAVGLVNTSVADNATNKGWSRSLHMAGNELVGAVEHQLTPQEH